MTENVFYIGYLTFQDITHYNAKVLVRYFVIHIVAKKILNTAREN